MIDTNWYLWSGGIYVVDSVEAFKEGVVIALHLIGSDVAYGVLLEKHTQDIRIGIMRLSKPEIAPFGIVGTIQTGGLAANDQVRYSFLVSRYGGKGNLE